MRVLISRDGVWRAEEHLDGWRLTMHGGPVLSRATLHQLVVYLLEQGVNAAEDMIKD